MATAGPFEEEVGATVSGDPLIGAQLGEYKVLSRLGEGAMGVVYRGEQPVIGKPVAIKVMQASFGSDPTHVKRLLEEARAISAARHPNIIDIFSFGQAPTGQHYFVMECLEGDPLDLYLRQQGGHLPPEEVARLLQQVAAGLSAAHAAGVVHRDLKPSNIFLARLGDGTRFVKLLDFGLAKRTAPNSGVRPTANVIVGTALYMAPEQATVGEVGPWTDLYAMGCVAHELLTGVQPFLGPSLIEMLNQHLTVAPTPVRRLDPTIPGNLEALVLELLEKAPAKRPKSAAIVKRALERIERQLATSRTRGTGLKLLSELEPSAQPARAKITQDSFRVDLPPGAGPAEERPTRLSLSEAQSRRSSRSWPLLVLAPILGVAAFFVAKQLDAPSPLLVPPPAPIATPQVVVAPVIPAPLPIEAPVPTPEPSPPPPAPSKRAAPTPPAAPAPSKRAVRVGHNLAEVDRRIARLRSRVRAELPDDGELRGWLSQLERVTTDSQSGTSLDELWKDLDDIERRAFARK